MFLTSSPSNNIGVPTSITKRLTGTGGGSTVGSSTDEAPTPTNQESAGTAHSYPSSARSTTSSPSDSAGALSSPTSSAANAVPNASQKSLDVGAIVGGAVGGLAALAIICVLVVRFCVRQRRKRLDAGNTVQRTGPVPIEGAGATVDPYGKPELDGEAAMVVAPAAAASGWPPSDRKVSEMPTCDEYKGPVVEIDGRHLG